MPDILTGVQEDPGCKLTAGESARQAPALTTANNSPSIGSDFGGPFVKRAPGPAPRIEVKQEWTAMRIEVRRDLLADVGAAILDVLAQFNPQTLTGARAVLAAIVNVKDTILGLIEPGHWSIKQDWEFSFVHQGAGNGVVVPSIVGTGWKNDAYFTWDVSIETSLNGASRAGRCGSSATGQGLQAFRIEPPPAFAATLGAGTNTVKQVVIVNVHFAGYEAEFQGAVDALQRAADWLGTKLDEVWQWFADAVRRIRGEPGLTPEQVQQREHEAQRERDAREAAAAADAIRQADTGKSQALRVVDRLRRHQAFLDVDYCDVIVICAAGTLEQLQARLAANAAATQRERVTGQLERVIEQSLEAPAPPVVPAPGGGRHRATPGLEPSSIGPSAPEALLVRQYEHKLKMRELVVARLLEAPPSTKPEG